jgi:hypothetical protein
MFVEDAMMLEVVQDPTEFLPVRTKKALPFTRGPLIHDRRRWTGLFKERRAEIPRLVPVTIPRVEAELNLEAD